MIPRVSTYHAVDAELPNEEEKPKLHKFFLYKKVILHDWYNELDPVVLLRTAFLAAAIHYFVHTPSLLCQSKSVWAMKWP